MELVVVLALEVVAGSSDWSSFDLRVGPLLFVAYERTTRVSVLTLGAGMALLALVGGALNAGGAALLQRRV